MPFPLSSRAFWLALAAALPAASGSPPTPLGEMLSVRVWSSQDSTRIAVELSQQTRWKYGSLSNPPRLFFDLLETRPRRGAPRIQVVPVGDARVRQARVALKDTRTTRLVLDLAADVVYEISRLTNPERLIIELRLKSSPQTPDTVSRTTPPERPANHRAASLPDRAQQARSAKSAPESAATATATGRNQDASLQSPNSTPAPAQSATQADRTPPAESTPAGHTPVPVSASPAQAAPSPPVRPGSAPETRTAGSSLLKPADAQPLGQPAQRSQPAPAAASLQPAPLAPAAAPSPPSASAPQPARPTRLGGQSLTRALGLHIGRVVLDPGHGGHDQGTHGPTGLLEKDLVLDVALRLGALLEERLGAEVVYTRQADEFIGLEERTAIANEKRADLFLSIHANSSPVRRVSGAEVFYLNFTTSRDALELAARENAGHNRSIFELRELIQKIALKDKLDESREFAVCVQQELSREWRRINSSARDRGVKTAPFVVLIGASMPSVLAEIGFLSNPKDETLLRKPDYRQRLAEALYRGIERYARGLGQSQALRAATVPESPQSTR